MRVATRWMVTTVLAAAVGGAACGNGGNGNAAACEVYAEVQASLRAATVDESTATDRAVERRLAALSRVTEGDALAAAAAKARQGWKAFRAASTSVPRDDFSAREAYFAALRPLDAFTRACGLAP